MDKDRAYQILELAPNATEQQIKDAYINLAQKYTPDNYQAGPLKEEAEKKMTDLNEAFDTLMSYVRTGSSPYTATDSTNNNGQQAPTRYMAIRELINNGHPDEALAELGALSDAGTDAEWNFLMGSAYYAKGMLSNALRYFEQAVNLEPQNPEYQAALRNLNNTANGQMPGNPYGTNTNASGAAVNCACNTCLTMCCLNACCGGCGR